MGLDAGFWRADDRAVRTELPAGTVTFLFTDVEGSTRLLHELGAEEYSRVLAEHRRVLRAAFGADQGVEVDTQGDAFFVAFPTAPGALGAAAAAVEGLGLGPIRVRVGVHTGTPHLGEDGYVGVDIHRAARIAACGHGGQVLVSSATAVLVGMDRLRDLGEHRLKDLSAPERIYQLGDGDFPPLKSLHRTNLPIPATAFLGRERELRDVGELVSRADVRLLTLTGPGGTGKTRLALQAAAEESERYPGGVFWVPLAPVRDPELVLDAARQAVGARGGLAEHIGDTSVLLLFDNFEHLSDAAADVAGLLGSCPGLDVLVTSREPLHLAGEQEYPVPSLRREEGVAFFTSRARAVKPDFGGEDVVGEICRRLDDLPLALELAAARVKALSPTQILERLDQRLPLLTGGARDAPERQRTLRATIEWSYDLLAEEEKSVFARLAVFRGGCTLDAAEQLVDASLDVMQSLVDKSLLRHAEERFWMLETIREYAAERLEHQEDAETLRQRHADHFLREAEEAEPHLTGSQPAPWLARLESEHDNLRLSLDSLRRAHRSSEELRLVGALMRFWYVRGHLREGNSRCEDALAAHDDQTESRLKALFGAGLLAHRLGDYQRAKALMQERLELARRLGDPEAVASSLIGVGLNAQGLGDYERAAAAYMEGAELARTGGHTWFLAIAIANLGNLALEQGDYADAKALTKESLALFRQLGDERKIVETLVSLGIVAAREGRSNEAAALLHQALEYAKAHVDKELAIWCVDELAALTLSNGDAEQAARLTGAIETQRTETGHAPTPDQQRLNEQTRNALASELGEERLAAALTAGREMTFDQAMACALQTEPDTADTRQPLE
jgi:predicted ATPase/class 3 adenylate cyclase/plasmid stability protein